MKDAWSQKSVSAKRYKGMNAMHSSTNILVAMHEGRLTPPDAIERLAGTDRNGLMAAAGLSVEQAVEAPSFEKSDSWIQRASSLYDRVAKTDSSGVGCDELTASSLFAHSQLPLISYLACFGELPPVALIKPAYEASVGVAKRISEAIRLDTGLNYNHRLGSAGVQAEAGVILLGQRYAINNIGDGSWLPIHSLYSEDNANRQYHLGENRAWDVTFFTQLQETPEKSYLVQVKNRDNPESGNRYGDSDDKDIIRIHYDPELTLLSDGYKRGIRNTIDELFREEHGDASVTRSLDARTDKLLEILG